MRAERRKCLYGAQFQPVLGTDLNSCDSGSEWTGSEEFSLAPAQDQYWGFLEAHCKESRDTSSLDYQGLIRLLDEELGRRLLKVSRNPCSGDSSQRSSASLARSDGFLQECRVCPLNCHGCADSTEEAQRPRPRSLDSGVSAKRVKKRIWSSVLDLGRKAGKKLLRSDANNRGARRLISPWAPSRSRHNPQRPGEEQIWDQDNDARLGCGSHYSYSLTDDTRSETFSLGSSLSSFILDEIKPETLPSNSSKLTLQFTPSIRIALSRASSRTRYQTFTMEPPRVSRFLDPSSALAAISRHKAEAIRLAREQGAAVREMCRRAKTEPPPYEFEELIGKGAYGRVYKGHQLPSRQVVALKVLDIDSLDYKSVRDFKDESIKDFIHETKVMKQVKDAGAKNINEIIEAVSIHSQLWLVCEYCPGGSVRTLMRATGDRLEEKFAIPVARELAAGLRAIHDAGIIHRDIKAANVLIHEEGRLQICDFGVAGVLQSQMDKRSTWIGTPHWMPPEMFTGGQGHQYSSEIDVWAYGCTLFEIATGNPPNANLRERMQIGRQLNRNTPKLADSDKYGEGLKELVAFALNSDPLSRPTMTDIMQHPYIANSEEEYPTSSLSELVRIYYQWSQRGGQRISLFHPGGAAAAEVPEDESDIEEDWNFSTTDDFERRFSVIDLDQLAASLAEMEHEINDTGDQSQPESTEEASDTEMTEHDKANFDERVRRGAAAMEGLFDEEKPSYKYETKNDFVPIEEKAPVSDLPLRTDTDRSSVTSTFIDIDIGSFDSSHYAAGATTAQPFQLADADTIRANRSSGRQNRSSNEARSRSSSSGVSSTFDSQDTFQPRSGPRPPTMDWKFPVFMSAPEEEPEIDSGAEAESESEPDHIQDAHTPLGFDPSEKRATMDWTFPVMGTADDETTSEASSAAASPRHDTLKASTSNIDLSESEPVESRPSTSQSNISTSSDTDYDPFRFDRPPTPPEGLPVRPQTFTDNDFPEILTSGYNRSSQSSILEGPGPDEEEEDTTTSWQNTMNINTTAPPPYSEPFPTAIPSKEIDAARQFPFPTADDSPMSEPLPTARYDPHPHPQSHPPSYHTSRSRSSLQAQGGQQQQHLHLHPIQFPDLISPRLEVLMDGAGEAAVTAELDRLLGDFLDALSATGEALGRTKIGVGVREAAVAEKEE
ncbi:hypothetical protein BJY04DRAFT_224402 [Aspergillus karnatakaensis]|uniref:putative serine/threonine protein kinase n=1 Tax=Aspergillus karnatakaensis TaxID=1810916 RepID=UPI003CCE269A